LSFFDRLYDGLQSQMQLRADLDRTIARLDRMGSDLLDHEKRLVRLETLVEVARGDFGARRLPPE